MPLPPSLQKSMPALGKFGIFLGIMALTNSPELTEFLTTAGVGAANTKATLEIIKTLASDSLSDSFKEFLSNNFDKSLNLQQAFQKGIAKALDELKTTFLAEHKHTVSDNERQQIELFFQSLAHHLSNEPANDAQINDYVRDRAAFFGNLIRKVLAPSDDEERAPVDTVLIPDLSLSTADQLTQYLVTYFEPMAQRNINEEFKTNDKAKTAYFIHLLEYSAQTNQSNNDLLLQVSQSLDDIGQHHQLHTDLLHQVAHSQQRIYDMLRMQGIEIKLFVRDFDQFKDRIKTRPEPSLRIPNNYKHPKKSHGYKYELRYTSFISRDAEINQLWDFLNGQPDRRMLWWLVTGPGGMGKNRLALEFCLEARCVNRYVGFLESHHIAGFDWSKWMPSHPTLLVIDNVAAHAEPTQKMIGQLSRSAQDGLLTQPVRVLLLERETRDEWWASFSEDLDVVESSYVSGQPDEVLALPAFTDADRWQIIAEIHHKEGKPLPADQYQTIQNLVELDPEGRPLFAFLAGMALAKGENIRHWNVDDLLDNHLQREEREIWAKHPDWAEKRCREGHKNLLMLTTLTRGLSVPQLKELLTKSLLYLPNSKLDKGLYKLLSSIREREFPNGTMETVYEGLRPDLVGEYYVLKRIDQLLEDDFTGKETVQELLQLAWDTSPGETWGSIWHTLTDFNRFPDARQYIEESCPLPNAPEIDWLYWSSLQFNLTTTYGRQGDMEKAENYYKKLQTLVNDHPYSEGFMLQQAKGAINLAIYYGDQKNMANAQAHYEDLQMLAQAYPHNEDIVLAQAEGAYHLITDYGKYRNMVMAEKCYEELQILAGDYSHNKKIALQQAKAAMNLTEYYSTQQDIVNAQPRYADLQELAKQYHNSIEIALQQAKGIGSQLYFTSEEEKKKRKTYFLTLLDELEALLSAYGADELWRETLPLLTRERYANQWLKS